MKPSDHRRFDAHYKKLLTALKLNEFRKTTIKIHARAVRRLDEDTGCPLNWLTSIHT